MALPRLKLHSKLYHYQIVERLAFAQPFVDKRVLRISAMNNGINRYTYSAGEIPSSSAAI